ncbi:MAG: hypothetical protein ISR78_01325 [Spirochaetia bacterium]|nr:hypothetical protein [Spirochaetia bacterium]
MKSYLNCASDVDIALQSISLRAKSVPPVKTSKREKGILSSSFLFNISNKPFNKGMAEILKSQYLRIDKLLISDKQEK